MASSQDTEITLGTGKLLGLFFFLVAICAVFFALGYTLGRKSDAGLLPASSSPAQTASNAAKSGNVPAQPMTFYKAVEQKEANPQLTPAAADAGQTGASSSNPTPAAASPASQSAATDAPNAAPTAALPTSAYFVQVAAVSKQDDAEALVDALKKKQYPAFVAENAAADKLFRVQVGPFSDVKEAEAMRARLISDGYSPILKK